MIKKRILIPIIVLIVFAAIAIGSTGESSGSGKKEITTGNSSNKSGSEITSENKNNSSPGSQTSVSIDEKVLIDVGELKVTATEYKVDSIWGDGINLLIENNGSSDIGLGLDALIVNDYMITDLFSATVAAGKKSNESVYFSSSSLEAAGIDTIGRVELYLHTFDPNSYSTIERFDRIEIETSAVASMDTTPNDAGQELYNEGGIRIVGKYVDENSFWGAGILLYIENNRGKNAIVQCDDLSINGFMMTPFFSATVYDGKKSISEISLMSSELEQNNITSIEDIELKFKIMDEDFMNSVESSVISFSAK